MNAGERVQALYIQTGGGATFSLFHPASKPSRERAVLICPPFGWEDMCSYRGRREWAEQLALAGYPTLRIDLPGTGDSEGGPRDPARLQAWTDAVRGAASWLRQGSDASTVVAIGLGLGGMIACRAACGSTEIDELVLWSVPARGRTLVRQLRAFAAMEVANLLGADETAPQGAADTEEGALVANGYLMSAETVRALEALDLGQKRSGPAGALRRVLLLGRDGLKPDPLLGEALRDSAEVTVGDGRGYGAMMVEPQDSRAPTDVFARVEKWLGEGAVARPPVNGAAGEAPSKDARKARVQSSGELLLGGARDVRERPIHIDTPAGQLFGVLAEPLAERSELCAVLLNAGPQRRIGPNRMWVEIARRWAAHGVPTLRLDVEAIGDSDGDAAALVRVASLYTPAYVQQVSAVLDTLTELALPQRFVLLGLCSGAYWSAHTALQDSRVSGVILLNPRALIWDEYVHAVRRTRELRERLLRASTWRKVLTGQITPARHLETGRALAQRAVSFPLRARRRFAAAEGGEQAGGQASLENLFEELAARRQRALLVFTGSEPLYAEITEKGLLGPLQGWSNLDLQILGSSADTHTLTPLWLQRQVHAVADSALEAELETLPSADPGVV